MIGGRSCWPAADRARAKRSWPASDSADATSRPTSTGCSPPPRLRGSIPYEDLAVQLGETGPLDEAALAARLLRDGRGGYCFELNTRARLRCCAALGFAVTHHQAVVGGEGPTNHMVAARRTSTASAGSPTPGWAKASSTRCRCARARTTIGPFTLHVEPRGGRHVVDGLSTSGARSPASGWRRRRRRCARLRAAPHAARDRPRVARSSRRSSCSGRVRTGSPRSAPGRCRPSGLSMDDKRVVADEAEFYAVLAREFGVTRRDPRLWAQACAQHEEFLARSTV